MLDDAQALPLIAHSIRVRPFNWSYDHEVLLIRPWSSTASVICSIMLVSITKHFLGLNCAKIPGCSQNRKVSMNHEKATATIHETHIPQKPLSVKISYILEHSHLSGCWIVAIIWLKNYANTPPPNMSFSMLKLALKWRRAQMSSNISALSIEIICYAQ